MPLQAPISFAGITVKAGERQTIDLPAARLYTHTHIDIPIQVVHGRRAGPCLFVSGVIHGDEIIGVEIIRRLMQSKTLKNLKGTLVAIPVVNVFGFIQQSRYLPDRRDLNRFFPGSETGSLTSQLAHLFMEEVVRKCTHGIDLHAGSNHRENLPQIRAYLDNDETLRLAEAFGAPVIMDANLLEGSLRQHARDEGLQMLLYEGGEALRFTESAVKVGLRGVISVMRAIGMLTPSKRKRHFQPLVSKSSTWVRAPISGLLNARVKLGDYVKLKQTLGHIVDPYGEESEPIIAKAEGIIVGRVNLPLVHRGEALFHIARVNDAVGDETIEAYRQEFDPEV